MVSSVLAQRPFPEVPDDEPNAGTMAWYMLDPSLLRPITTSPVFKITRIFPKKALSQPGDLLTHLTSALLTLRMLQRCFIHPTMLLEGPRNADATDVKMNESVDVTIVTRLSSQERSVFAPVQAGPCAFSVWAILSWALRDRVSGCKTAFLNLKSSTAANCPRRPQSRLPHGRRLLRVFLMGPN